MQGVLWHSGNDGWEKVFIEIQGSRVLSYDVDDDEGDGGAHAAGVPCELKGQKTNDVDCSGADVVLAQADGPTNFGLSVTLADGAHQLLFCALEKKQLVQWRKTLKQASEQKSDPRPVKEDAPGDTQEQEGVESETDSVLVPDQESGQAHDGEDDDEEEMDEKDYRQVLEKLGSRGSSGRSLSNSPRASPDRDSARKPPNPIQLHLDPSQDQETDLASTHVQNEDQARPEEAKEIHDAEQLDESFDITVNFDDLEMDLSFSSQRDLDRVTILDLKLALAEKINSEGGRFVNATDLHLSLAGAVLRESWCGRDFGLRHGACLDASSRKGPTEQERFSKKKRVLLDLNLQVGGAGQHTPVIVHDGDVPEDVANRLCSRLGVDASTHALPVTCELYKQLAMVRERENQVLRNQVHELKRIYEQGRLTATAPVEGRSRIIFESLLEHASKRIDALDAEKKALSDQLFELRLVNAERLSST